MNEQEASRRAQCEACVGKCWAWKVGKLDPANPSAGCARMIWERPAVPVAMPPSAAPVIVIPSTQPSLWRTLRGWKRAGILMVSRPERRQRGPICAVCIHVIRHSNGLLGCGAGCNCGAAAVSVMRQDAKCKRGLWPAAPLQASGSGIAQED